MRGGRGGEDETSPGLLESHPVFFFCFLHFLPCLLSSPYRGCLSACCCSCLLMTTKIQPFWLPLTKVSVAVQARQEAGGLSALTLLCVHCFTQHFMFYFTFVCAFILSVLCLPARRLSCFRLWFGVEHQAFREKQLPCTGWYGREKCNS